jgi:hypothetical protein
MGEIVTVGDASKAVNKELWDLAERMRDDPRVQDPTEEAGRVLGEEVTRVLYKFTDRELIAAIVDTNNTLELMKDTYRIRLMEAAAGRAGLPAQGEAKPRGEV